MNETMGKNFLQKVHLTLGTTCKKYGNKTGMKSTLGCYLTTEHEGKERYHRTHSIASTFINADTDMICPWTSTVCCQRQAEKQVLSSLQQSIKPDMDFDKGRLVVIVLMEKKQKKQDEKAERLGGRKLERTSERKNRNTVKRNKNESRRKRKKRSVKRKKDREVGIKNTSEME